MTFCHAIVYFNSLICVTFSRKLQKHNTTTSIIQRCIALFCMLLFFLVGIDQVENDIICTIMSLTIQYFTMVSVFWIAAEAVLMFRQLTMGFERASWKQILLPPLVCWCKLLPACACEDLAKHTVNPSKHE